MTTMTTMTRSFGDFLHLEPAASTFALQGEAVSRGANQDLTAGGHAGDYGAGRWSGSPGGAGMERSGTGLNWRSQAPSAADVSGVGDSGDSSAVPELAVRLSHCGVPAFKLRGLHCGAPCGKLTV